MSGTKNEAKRNSIWKIVMSVSTVLIIIIAAFFIIKLFTSNPLEGEWRSTDSGLTMDVKEDGIAEFQWQENSDEDTVKLEIKYAVDKKAKTFTLYTEESVIGTSQKDSEEADNLMDTLDTSYDYNIEKNILTLTDREYGEQMIFEKE